MSYNASDCGKFCNVAAYAYCTIPPFVVLWKRMAGLSSSPLKGVQGSPCRGLGCPQFPSLLPAPPAAHKREEKKFLRGHPASRQRAAALCTPAGWENWKALKRIAEPIDVDLFNVLSSLL